MAKRIALFNPKGGVGKTTATFNLGRMLASKGKRVILVDTDPQANLTDLVLGYKGPSELQRFYEEEPDRNLKAGLEPAFESHPMPMKAIDCIPVEGQEGLFLLPGHIGLSEYEVSLGLAQNLSGFIQTLQNLPGSISVLLEKTAKKFQADYVLIDMNPSLSSFNQNMLMTSDYFILPTSPDYFSVMAIDSLSGMLPKWHRWAVAAQSSRILREAIYPFPCVTPKFMGTIVQNYRPLSGALAKNFQIWIDGRIDRINNQVREQLVPALEDMGMVFSEETYQTIGIEDYCLAQIPDFNPLIAMSLAPQSPVSALTDEQINQVGAVLDVSTIARGRFMNIFSEFADKVIDLTND